VPITAANPFKWRHYPGDIIMWCVRWYLRYPISVAQMGEMTRERGLAISGRESARVRAKHCHVTENQSTVRLIDSPEILTCPVNTYQLPWHSERYTRLGNRFSDTTTPSRLRTPLAASKAANLNMCALWFRVSSRCSQC
jgi:hypothetical protein